MEKNKRIQFLDINWAEIKFVLDNINSRHTPYIYFVDKSFLSENFLSFVSKELIFWNLHTAYLNQQLIKRGKRLIKRLLPIQKKEYSKDEIKLIKYSLNCQLALGFEVYVVFTLDINFLESHFNSNNFIVVKKIK